MDLCAECGTRPIDRDGVCFRCRMASVGMTGLVRLSKEREGGYTQRELGKDIFDSARRDGREIERVR